MGRSCSKIDWCKHPFLIRARVVLLRDLGSALSPFNSFQIIQGIETLALRMKKHCENAGKVKLFLEKNDKVKKVIFSTNQNDFFKKNAKKYLTHGKGGLLGIELKGGLEAGKSFINNLKLFYHVANIGDVRSLAIHPASTTHSQLSNEEMLKAGVTPGYIRLSIGIEHPDDIINDIQQSLNKI